MNEIKKKLPKPEDKLSDDMKVLDELTSSEYKWGFVTDIDTETVSQRF
jgi:hypothetical protein